MARPIRIEFVGAFYHVSSRGDRREPIYEDDADRECFLKVLGQVAGDFNWACHAWRLMDNHYHLVAETPDGNLSKGMRQLNGVYTQSRISRPPSGSDPCLVLPVCVASVCADLAPAEADSRAMRQPLERPLFRPQGAVDKQSTAAKTGLTATGDGARKWARGSVRTRCDRWHHDANGRRIPRPQRRPQGSSAHDSGRPQPG